MRLVALKRLGFYSTVALAHQAVQNPDKTIDFLKFVGSKVKYFIGNENIPRDVLETVFNEDVIHIKTPARVPLISSGKPIMSSPKKLLTTMSIQLL